MADKPKVYCWDSVCFIALFCKENGRVDICQAIIDAAKKEQVKLFTSFLTLAECVRIPAEYPAIAEDQIAEFFKNVYIYKVSVDWYVTLIARDLQRRFKLKPRDAIHLATAIHVKADYLHTYDGDDLLKLDSKIPGINLRIIEPAFEFQPTLSQHNT